MTTKGDVTALQRAIETQLPEPWRRWPKEVEAALLDSVLFIGVRYGSENTAVRGAVEWY